MNQPTHDDQAATSSGQIVCTVMPEQVEKGHYLLGRYNTITDFLTEVMIISNRDLVPPLAGEHVRFALIGTGADKVPGMPLDEFVEHYCRGFDGTTAINLYFNPHNGGFENWSPAYKAADQADRFATLTESPRPPHSDLLREPTQRAAGATGGGGPPADVNGPPGGMKDDPNLAPGS